MLRKEAHVLTQPISNDLENGLGREGRKEGREGREGRKGRKEGSIVRGKELNQCRLVVAAASKNHNKKNHTQGCVPFQKVVPFHVPSFTTPFMNRKTDGQSLLFPPCSQS